MTAQINDVFRYRQGEYSVAGISEGALFDPAVLGMKPAMAGTACWRGYMAIFAVSNGRLILDALRVNLFEEGEGYPRKEGPVINCVKPTAPKSKGFFNNLYEGLEYELQYSGGLLLGKGFIRDLYVHMGFHPAWKYEAVIELIFDNGVMVKENDCSERAAEIRRTFMESRDKEEPEGIPDQELIEKFVESAFDRSYEM